MNDPQLVGAQDGSTVVPMYNWDAYFDESTTKVLGIKKYQHFQFSSEHPGKVFLKSSTEGIEKEVTILKSHHNLLGTFQSLP